MPRAKLRLSFRRKRTNDGQHDYRKVCSRIIAYSPIGPANKTCQHLSFVCIVFLANNVQTYALLGLFTFGVIALTRVPFSFLLKGLKPIIWIVAFTFLLHIFMTHEGSVIFQLGWFKVYEGGLIQGFLSPSVSFTLSL